MGKVILQELLGDMEEATVDYWCVEEGDEVAEGDDLVQLDTEEGPHSVQAPFTGVVREIFFAEGETVGLGDLLCEIDEDSQDE